VVEWQGGKKNIKLVNELCSLVEKNFHSFVATHGFKTDRNIKFNYSISFLPYDTKYRHLNDLLYRFANRLLQRNDLTGYTDHDTRYVFNISDISDDEFTVSFVHELFHAMSHTYGLFDSFSGSKYDKIRSDEALAQKFTESLG